MQKPIEEMNRQELGALFPIRLSPYDPAWPERYEEERACLEQAVGGEAFARLHHIGSTAVPGLLAKPAIDLLMEIRPHTDPTRLLAAMKALGYRFSPQPDRPAPHMMFMKGYTPYGFRGQAFHVHVRYEGDWDELYFRDYLRVHPDAAARYAQLKQDLQRRFEHDREEYTEGKGAFVREITALARQEFSAVHRRGNPARGSDAV